MTEITYAEHLRIAAEHEAAHVVAALTLGHHVPYVLVREDLTGFTAGSGAMISAYDKTVETIIGPVYEAREVSRIHEQDLAERLAELAEEWERLADEWEHGNEHWDNELCTDVCMAGPYEPAAIDHAGLLLDLHAERITRLGAALVERGQLDWREILDVLPEWSHLADEIKP